MDHTRGDSRYNLNYSMSGIGLTLADQSDIYGNPPAGASLVGRPPSTGLLQNMSSGGASGGILPRSTGNLMTNTTQCQSLGNNSSVHNSSQQRSLKRVGSDCYDSSHHRSGAGDISSLQGLDNCVGAANVQHRSQQSQSSGNTAQDIVEDNYNTIQNKKSPPANGKKTKGRVKIKMEYIDNKLRRYTTFSKRKTGIMKKAYELSTLTGTQVMLLVASETGHVYTFATRKLQPMITSEAGKQLIQTCLNSPDPPSVGGGDQRMSATGFEETELSYNIADEDSKEIRSPLSSINDSDDSSDFEGTGIMNNYNCINTETLSTSTKIGTKKHYFKAIDKQETNQGIVLVAENKTENSCHANFTVKNEIAASSKSVLTSQSDVSNISQSALLKLIEADHLQVHTEEGFARFR